MCLVMSQTPGSKGTQGTARPPLSGGSKRGELMAGDDGGDEGWWGWSAQLVVVEEAHRVPSTVLSTQVH